MHLGNAALSPECAIATAALAATGMGFAAASLRAQAPSRKEWLAAGAYGSAIFAVQMLNVPVFSDSSAHFVGGVLLALALRPALGALTMAAILAAQAILLGDGGILSLGANVLNMALLPAGLVALGNAWQPAVTPLWRAAALGGLQAALAVVLAALLIVVEVGIGRSHAGEFASAMLRLHMLVGVLEGLVTAGLVWAARGDFVARKFAWRMALACGATLACVALLPLASELPDGYEAAALTSRWGHLLEGTSLDVALASDAASALLAGGMAAGCAVLAFRAEKYQPQY